MNNRHYGHDLQYKQIIYIKNVVYLLIAEGSRLVDVQDDVRVVVDGSKFNITTTAGTLTGVHIHCAPQSRRRWFSVVGRVLGTYAD